MKIGRVLAALLFVVLAPWYVHGTPFTIDQMLPTESATIKIDGFWVGPGPIGDFVLRNPITHAIVYDSYCTDPIGEITIGGTYNFGSTMCSPTLTGLDPARPWAKYGLMNALSFASAHMPSGLNSVGRAAAQLDVWELEYDSTGQHSGTFDLSTGRFQVPTISNPAVLALANQWLNDFLAQPFVECSGTWLYPDPSNYPHSPGQGILIPGHRVADSKMSVIPLASVIGLLFLMRPRRPTQN